VELGWRVIDEERHRFVDGGLVQPMVVVQYQNGLTVEGLQVVEQ